MKNDILLIGLILIIIGIFFTFITFGLAIVCLWPVIFIGIILLIIGMILPNFNERIEISYKNSDIKFCKYCGNNIHINSNFCSKCGKKIEY